MCKRREEKKEFEEEVRLMLSDDFFAPQVFSSSDGCPGKLGCCSPCWCLLVETKKDRGVQKFKSCNFQSAAFQRREV